MLKENGYGGNLDNIAKVIWGYVETMKASQEGRTVYSTPDKEKELFKLTMEKIASAKGNMNMLDLSEFFMVSTDSSSYDDFKERLVEFVRPKNFEFYFQLGPATNFEEGYCLGTGKLSSFNSLPGDVKEHMLHASRVDEPGTELSREWFMTINVESLGPHKSLETAIQQLRRNISIYRITHLVSEDDFYSMSLKSPYKYVAKDGTRILSYGYDFGHVSFFRNKDYDAFVSMLNGIANKKLDKPNEIEKRITNALDSFGITESTTPLHLKFVLCVFSLEGLVLGNEDKEGSLKKKLSEKIALLVLDASNWQNYVKHLSPASFSSLESLIGARVWLAKELEKIYDKRSTVAHSGVGSDKISIEDYNFISKVLRLVVMKLSELTDKNYLGNNSITHINKNKSLLGDRNSLDTLIDVIKYS
jgi:hypothetical protein